MCYIKDVKIFAEHVFAFQNDIECRRGTISNQF